MHQQLRELRAGSRRRLEGERGVTERRALVLQRKLEASVLDCRTRAPRELQQLSLALAGHDPQRTLERGYAVVESPDGAPLSSAEQARVAKAVRLRFADGAVAAQVQER